MSPIQNYNLARTWDALYLNRLKNGSLKDHPLWDQEIGYGRTRANVMVEPYGDISWHRGYWAALSSALAIPTNATIAMIGAGFGFLCEAALDAGWTNAQAVDDSDWIDAHRTDLAWRHDGNAWVQNLPNASVPIIKASLDNPNSLRNALGGRQDFVITEFMLSSLQSPADPRFDAGTESDELTQAFNNCETVATVNGTVVHLVTCIPFVRPGYHRKTLAEWKALRPAHRFAPASHLWRFWEVL